MRTYGGDATESPWRVWVPSTSLSARRERDLHVLLWQVTGQAELVVDGQERELTDGHAMWVPAGTQHEFTVHANSVLMPLFFRVSDTATTLREPTLVTIDRDLRTLMLAYAVSTSTIIEPHANLSRQILALIEQKPVLVSALPMPAAEPAQSVAEALRFNPGDIRGVDELAASVHTSARSIERAFRAETGMTLRQWRIRNRVEAAAVLLRSGAGTDAVAHRVGYTNVNAFRRVFKEHFGLSPTQYTARYRSQ